MTGRPRPRRPHSPAPSELDPVLLEGARDAASAALGASSASSVDLQVMRVERREKGRLSQLQATLPTGAGPPARLDLILKQLVARPEDLPPKGELGPGVRRRPRLAVVRPFAERAAGEFASLVAVEQRLASAPDPRFRPVRALRYFPDQLALLMEHVPGVSLRTLVASSVARPRRRSTGDVERAQTAVSNAGAWLRWFHASPGPLGSSDVPARHRSVADVVAAARELCVYLADLVGPPAYFEGLARQLEARLRRDLPDPIPLGLAHADYAPRNIVVGSEGVVAVLDIAGWMLAPCYEDIAYLVVSMRLPPLAAVAQGLTQDSAEMERLEQAFAGAYFLPEPVPWGPLRLYQALVLLDRWCGRPPAPPQLPGGRLVATLAGRLLDRAFRAELERLLSD